MKVQHLEKWEPKPIQHFIRRLPANHNHTTGPSGNQDVEDADTSRDFFSTCTNILPSTALVPEDDPFCSTALEDPAINDIMAYIESLDDESEILF